MSPVTRLLNRCCPYAVAGLVVAIYIEPLDGVPLGWPAAHVMKKSSIITAPLVTYCYAPTSIMLKPQNIRVEAARFDMPPNAILSGVGLIKRGISVLSLSDDLMLSHVT